MDPQSQDYSKRETASFTPHSPAIDESSLTLPPTKRPPSDFGDYRIMELLGRGTFGQVYRVWSASTQRFEAMKVLHREVALDREQLDAFRNEIRRMANVRSANVAQVYHVDVLPDGRPFFTMEYLNGGRLDHCCDRMRSSLEDRIRAIADICDAVHGMHELNLVHCDIKPANIVADEDAGALIPKLVDFGLASQRAFRPSPTSTPRGTLPYMAPEQLESRGGEPDRQWDVYALGATLYQLVVGECPIQQFPDFASSPAVLADYVRRTPVPPLWARTTLIGSPRTDDLAAARQLSVDRFRRRLHDPWLDAVVRKAIAKQRHERYASAGEMAENLRRYLGGARPTIVAPTVRDRVREFAVAHRTVLVGFVFLVVLALAIGFGYARHVAALSARVNSGLYEGLAAADPRYAVDAFTAALEIDPSRDDVRLHLASAWAANGSFEQAMQAARSIAENDEHFEQAQAFIAGLSQFRFGVPTDHDAVAREARVPPGDEYYYALALGPDDALIAIDLLGKALKAPGLTRDDQFRIRLMRALRYLQVCDVDAFETEVQWLVDTMPSSAVVWNLQGIAHASRRQFVKAVDAYNKAIDLNSSYDVVYVNRADLNNVLQRPDRALADYDRAVTLQPANEARVQSGRVLAWTLKGDDESARGVCEHLSVLPTVTPDLRLACGRMWFEQSVWERAWNDLDEAINAPHQYDRCNDTWVYEAPLVRGFVAAKLMRYRDAINDFDSAEAAKPERWRNNWTNYLTRGRFYLLDHNPEGAVSDLRTAARLTKEDLMRAKLYLWIWDAERSIGRLSEAEVSLQHARVAAKENGRLARIVGHCAGDVEQEAVLKVAANESLDNQVEAYYYLGLAAKARGDKAGAEHWFQSCRSTPVAPGLMERELAEMQLASLNNQIDSERAAKMRD